MSKTNKNIVEVDSKSKTGASNKKFDPVAAGEAQWKPSEAALKQETPLRIGAWVLWLLAIAGELFTIFYTLKQKPVNNLLLFGGLVLIAIFAIVASQLWKKANQLNPASSKDGFRFFVQNQLGAIMSILAFLPLIVLILTNKNLDQKQKAFAGGLGAVLVVVAALLGADFNPPSVEQNTFNMQAATATAMTDSQRATVDAFKALPAEAQTATLAAIQTDANADVTPAAPASPEEVANVVQYTGVDKVYWKKGGTVYHLCADASALQRESSIDDNIYTGTVADAHAAGKVRLTLEVNQELNQCGLTNAPTATPYK